jgi:hypothetical protein
VNIVGLPRRADGDPGGHSDQADDAAPECVHDRSTTVDRGPSPRGAREADPADLKDRLRSCRSCRFCRIEKIGKPKSACPFPAKCLSFSRRRGSQGGGAHAQRAGVGGQRSHGWRSAAASERAEAREGRSERPATGRGHPRPTGWRRFVPPEKCLSFFRRQGGCAHAQRAGVGGQRSHGWRSAAASERAEALEGRSERPATGRGHPRPTGWRRFVPPEKCLSFFGGVFRGLSPSFVGLVSGCRLFRKLGSPLTGHLKRLCFICFMNDARRYHSVF